MDFTITVLLLAVSASIAYLFMYCYFGKLATESYENMANCLYQSNWAEFSIETQKYILLMIMNVQQTIHYHGFGVAVLNLETFCTVINNQMRLRSNSNRWQLSFFILFQLIRNVVTYFMAFKALTEWAMENTISVYSCGTFWEDFPEFSIKIQNCEKSSIFLNSSIYAAKQIFGSVFQWAILLIEFTTIADKLKN